MGPIKNVEIPYGAYGVTPFTKWQGSYSICNSMKFAAQCGKRQFGERNIDPLVFDSGGGWV